MTRRWWPVLGVVSILLAAAPPISSEAAPEVLLESRLRSATPGGPDVMLVTDAGAGVFRSEDGGTGACWNQTRVLSDDRIPAMGSGTTAYRFADPGRKGPRWRSTCLYRRAYLDLAESKGWDIDDLVTETAAVTVAG